MSAATDSVIPKQGLTQEEIANASGYLAGTRDALVEAVTGLTNAQWELKAAPDCWSIAEIVEHVALIEDGVHIVIGKMGEAPLSAADSSTTQMDDLIMREVPRRTTKVMAPPHVMPTHRWSGPGALEYFVRSREQTSRLLSAPFLRGHVLPHPVFGQWDGYQWILAAGAHSARHTNQIEEVKSAPGFWA